MKDDDANARLTIGMPNWPAALIIVAIIGGCVANNYVKLTNPDPDAPKVESK